MCTLIPRSLKVQSVSVISEGGCLQGKERWGVLGVWGENFRSSSTLFFIIQSRISYGVLFPFRPRIKRVWISGQPSPTPSRRQNLSFLTIYHKYTYTSSRVGDHRWWLGENEGSHCNIQANKKNANLTLWNGHTEKIGCCYRHFYTASKNNTSHFSIPLGNYPRTFQNWEGIWKN